MVFLTVTYQRHLNGNQARRLITFYAVANTNCIHVHTNSEESTCDTMPSSMKYELYKRKQCTQ